MLDEDFGRVRAYHNNIHRYRNLLKTQLLDLERQFVERRLSEEAASLEALTVETGFIAFSGRSAAHPSAGASS
jgi:hypothetical protein